VHVVDDVHHAQVIIGVAGKPRVSPVRMPSGVRLLDVVGSGTGCCCGWVLRQCPHRHHQI